MFSPDVIDLRNSGLPDDRAFCVPLQVDFGPEGEQGVDQFDMLVCSPAWVAERSKEGPFFGSEYLVVSRFDIDEIERLLRELTEQCIGYSWSEVAKKLSKFAHWECEDMRESGWSVNRLAVAAYGSSPPKADSRKMN
jgi:hypothetical protein